MDITQFYHNPYDVQELWSELKAIVETVQNLISRNWWRTCRMKNWEAFAGRPPRSITSLIGWSFRAHLNVLRLCRVLPRLIRRLTRTFFSPRFFTILVKSTSLTISMPLTIPMPAVSWDILSWVDLVHQRLRKITGFDSLRLKLLHMIVSHHGKYEWQSPKTQIWKGHFASS